MSSADGGCRMSVRRASLGLDELRPKPHRRRESDGACASVPFGSSLHHIPFVIARFMGGRPNFLSE